MVGGKDKSINEGGYRIWGRKNEMGLVAVFLVAGDHKKGVNDSLAPQGKVFVSCKRFALRR
ncbi:hypothetical protein CCP2SC5_10063 [Azospirillaceae bacterium]